METGLDNSNNPFGMSNGANNTDNIMSQKSDGLLLNLTDNFKQNGTDLQASDFFSNEKANGKRLVSEFDDEDFGPETDVDALDDLLSPGPKEPSTKNFSDAFSTSPNNNLLAEEGVYNPFMEHQEKAAMELDNLRKREAREQFEEEERMAREETPTPPADTVHDVSGLVENPADSESEDEWDYFKGDEANKENITPKPAKEVAHIPEEDDTMSQLNPNAAEFVPVSPTRSVPSPSCRMLINDQIFSQSPQKANDVDINVPNLKDFEKEVKSRPSEIDENGHTDDLNKELMENILNGKNIDEIPEFHPGSTPKKVFTNDDFHFGPNAAPFTPKLLDQSEALSTKAVYGDDTVATSDTSFNESVSQDLNILNKESDPMSMSFYADKGDANPFDLNKVQVLPDNLEDFLNKPDNEAFNETISDLPEHDPLEEETTVLNNDDVIKIDKHSYDNEKELASPTEETDLSKTPEPTHENLIDDNNPAAPETTHENLIKTEHDVELVSPNPSPLPDATEFLNKDACEIGDVFCIEATEVDDLLNTEPTEVDNSSEIETINIGGMSMKTFLDIGNAFNKKQVELDEEITKDDVVPVNEEANNDLMIEKPEYLKDESEVSDLLRTETNYIKEIEDTALLNKIPEDRADLFRDFINDIIESHPAGLLEYENLPNDQFSLKEPTSESPQPKLEEFARLETINVDPVVSDDLESQPIHSETENDELKESIPVKPVCRLPLEVFTSLNEASDVSNNDLEPKSVSPLPEQVDESLTCARSEKIELEYPEKEESKSLVCDLQEAISPMPEAPISPDFTKEELLEEAQERFEELCKPTDVTSSVKDDLSFAEQDLSSKSPIEDQVIEDSFEKEDLDDVKVEEAVVEKREEISTTLPIDLNATLDQASPSENVTVDLDYYESPGSKCVCPRRRYPPEDYEELPIDVKTETISPEFAEPTVVTPSEESKAEDLIINAIDESIHKQQLDELAKTASTDEHIKEPELEKSIEERQTEDQVKEPHIEEQVKESHVEEQLKEHHTEEQVKESHIEEQLKEHHTEEQVKEPQTEEQVKERQIEERVEEPQTEERVGEPQREEQVNESQIEEPVKVSPIDIAIELSTEELVKEPQLEEQQEAEDIKNEITAVGVVAAVAAGAAITAVVSSTKVEDKKKTPSVSSAKKTTATKTLTSKSPAPVAKTSPRLSASAPKQTTSKTTTTLKATTQKTGTTKTPTSATTAPKPSPRLNSSKTKTAVPPANKTAPLKSTEKQPLTNGDVKTSAKNAAVKKTVSEVNGAKPASSTRLATGTSISKVSQSRVTSKPSAAAAAPAKTTIPPRTAPLAPKAPSTTAKRPTTLTSKSYSGSTSPDKSTSAVKATLSKTSPKSITNVPPRPKTATNAISKPKIPPTRTAAKAPPDTEKQIKESANKITASRSVSSAKPVGSTTTRSTWSSARKVESKVSSTRTTVSKTTTTTMKSTTAKKPTEIIRGPIKTKTTKIEKPKENGVPETVTEEITIVNNTNSVIETSQHHDLEPELIKDNSPVDNKLLIETTQFVETNAD